MRTIGIIGSRRRIGKEVIAAVEKAFLNSYSDGDRIVSGGCPVGADHFAEQLAKKHQVPITIHYARWDKHGKSAGFVRNKDIAKDANVLIAAVSSDRTGGTEDTIKHFLKDCHLSEQQAIENGRLILV